MSVIGAVIVPHPPIILPEVGKGREREIKITSEAFRAAAEQVAEWKPDVLVIASPHTIMYADYFHISPGDGAQGDMSDFGAFDVSFNVKYDADFRDEIIRLAVNEGIMAGELGERSSELDHGICVPMYFLEKTGVNVPVVRMGLSGFSSLDHYRLGMCVAQAADALNRRAVFIASGDLSHKLKEDGPYGFVPEGPDFDRQVTDAMSAGDFMRFLKFDQSFCSKAAECGLRSFQIMAGALDGLAVNSELLSYEGTFGVGYAVAKFAVTGADKGRRFGEIYEEEERVRLNERKAGEDPWVKLARLSLETYIGEGKKLKEIPKDLPVEMLNQSAGAFVSLQLHGQLRGCIGTIAPVTDSVADEIVRNAVSAGTEDPRFEPVRKEELDFLEYKVDVLGPAESVVSSADLDVKKYGVIVSCGGRRGLLLPDLDGVDTVEEQIDIACRKGGIRADEPYTLERFEVVRHI
ncbi:MAG: AmmeMemoRadiSam system protein A [Firmicutes bacterium]|nr:AmmeMemoRadiSam system protein A [Bacillota bacterium]